MRRSQYSSGSRVGRDNRNSPQVQSGSFLITGKTSIWSNVKMDLKPVTNMVNLSIEYSDKQLTPFGRMR